MLLPPPTCCIYAPKSMTNDLCPMDMQSPLRVHSMEEADLACNACAWDRNPESLTAMQMQSPLRVHSMEEADLIYLPIYAALECRLSQAMDGDAHKLAYHARVSCPIYFSIIEELCSRLCQKDSNGRVSVTDLAVI